MVSIELNLLFTEAVNVFVVPTLAVNACNVEILASADAVYVFKSAVVAKPNPLTTTEPVTCKL
jgi:Ni,Fe-hydrogenase III small subunit